MNKQELQDLIDGLQRNAVSQESVSADAEQETGDSRETTSRKDYVHISNSLDDKDAEPEATIVRSDLPVYGWVDYEGLLSYFGVKNEEVKHLWVDIGTRRPFAVEESDTFSVYSFDGKVAVPDTEKGKTACPNQYDIRIDLKRIYDVTGSADFKMYTNNGRYINFAYWVKKYSIYYKVSDMKLKTPPHKLRYQCGESFDRTGLVAEITIPSEGVKETTDFYVRPEVFGSDDTYVTIGYDDCEVKYPVVVDTTDGWNEEQVEHACKKISLGEKVEAILDLYNGKPTIEFTVLDEEAFSIPLSVKHLYNYRFGDKGFGQNWQLNLNRKLKLSQSDTTQNTIYTYVDENGDEKTFRETYYYIDEAGDFRFVEKNKVEVDLQGNLSFSGKSVHKHQSYGEFTLIPELNDFIHSDLIEQRQREQIELEEFVKSYEITLKSYVKAESATGKKFEKQPVIKSTNYASVLDEIKNDTSALYLSESEAMQLQSLYFNVEQCDIQLQENNTQKNNLNDAIAEYEKEYADFCKQENREKKAEVLSNAQSKKRRLPSETIPKFNICLTKNEKISKKRF